MLVLSLAAVALVSCEEWTEPRMAGLDPQGPEEQNPALYEEYLAQLRTYKLSEHAIVFAMLENSPEVSTSEKDFMRSLPDSLDMVVLLNADRLNDADREDMALMRRKGTKVLYHIDLCAYDAALSWGAIRSDLTACLDRAVAEYAAHGFDGFSVSGNVNMAAGGDSPEFIGTAAKAITDKLRSAAGPTGILLFTGNALFFSEEDRARYDYFAIDASDMKHALEMQNEIDYMHGYLSIPYEKLLVAATPMQTLTDRSNKVADALPQLAATVIACPLAGMGVLNIGEDYYDAKMNYRRTKEAIDMLNPSH